MNKILEAWKRVKITVERSDGDTDITEPDDLDILEEVLTSFDRLKTGIAWRKEDYEREIKTGVDPDGEPLSESNKLITLNLYNIMCALEAYYKEQ